MTTVPIYDARKEQFSLAHYTSKLPRYSEELQNNSIVAVTFTLGTYTLRADRVPDGGPSDLNMALSFNIKDVILLSDDIGPVISKPLEFAEPWGVLAVETGYDGHVSSPSSDQENIPPLEPSVDLV